MQARIGMTEILRLRRCFASRTSDCAQDDRLVLMTISFVGTYSADWNGRNDKVR
jgi:hypothetical protein